MDNNRPAVHTVPSDIKIMQMDIPAKMFVACAISSAVGIALMAVTGYPVLMAIFIVLLLVCVIDVPLVMKHVMSVETASLLPMLILCFVYTPLSWFTFDGLLGCTPYLSVLYAIMIVFTYYRNVQRILLPLYSLILAGLIAHWLITSAAKQDSTQVLNILIAYLITYAVTITIAESVKNKNIEINRHITDLSLRDGLTNLLNRRAVDEVLQSTERDFAATGADYALVMMDVDRFKNINDAYGHPIGDAVLQTLAQCIQSLIRAQDYAFRYGGDEFLLVLAKVDDAASARIRERIRAALRDVQGYAFSITVSVGCVLRSECGSVQDALALADKRMYAAKEEAREDEPERI